MDELNPYKSPSSNVAEEGQAYKAGFILWFFTIIILVLNTFLSLVVAPAGIANISTLFGFMFGSVLFFPLLILALSQIWKKHRNQKSRVKAILYPSILVLFSIFPRILELAQTAA